MRIDKEQIKKANDNLSEQHRRSLALMDKKYKNLEKVIDTIANYNIAIPSWALGAGGTRFGRFGFGGEPGDLEQKLEDIAVINDK